MARNRDVAAAAPVAFLFLLAVGFGWQFVYFEDDLPGFDPDDKIDAPNNSSDDTFGFLSPITGTLNAVFDGILLFANLLAFTLVDGPSEGVFASVWEVFKWAWRVVVSGTLLWGVIELFLP